MAQKLLSPPRFVQNERGETVEVILSVEDYRRFLKTLATHADWESLPSYLQDAIDQLLAEESAAEPGAAKPLRNVVGKPGETS